METTTSSSSQAGPAERDVQLVGGPPDWRGRTLRLRVDPADPATLGAYLISRHTPVRDPDEDTAPRAIYEPADDGSDPLTWYFQGWFPSSPSDPDPAAYLATSPDDGADAP